jgi:hypothetical protein
MRITLCHRPANEHAAKWVGRHDHEARRFWTFLSRRFSGNLEPTPKKTATDGDGVRGAAWGRWGS